MIIVNYFCYSREGRRSCKGGNPGLIRAWIPGQARDDKKKVLYFFLFEYLCGLEDVH